MKSANSPTSAFEIPSIAVGIEGDWTAESLTKLKRRERHPDSSGNATDEVVSIGDTGDIASSMSVIAGGVIAGAAGIAGAVVAGAVVAGAVVAGAVVAAPKVAAVEAAATPGADAVGIAIDPTRTFNCSAVEASAGVAVGVAPSTGAAASSPAGAASSDERQSNKSSSAIGVAPRIVVDCSTAGRTGDSDTVTADTVAAEAFTANTDSVAG